MKKHFLIFTISLLFFTLAQGKVKLPAMMGDHMVLQQNSSVKLWGWADGKKVTVTTSWNNRTYKVSTDDEGAWLVKVDTPAGSFTPYSITISDGTRVTLSDILIGEVWICSGQSNMEMTMKGNMGQPIDHSLETLLNAGNYRDRIRFITVPRTKGVKERTDFEGAKWEVSSPETTMDCSAAGYFFARQLTETLHLPVGPVSYTHLEFMQKYDPRLSLAPRDIVARAIDNEMKNRGDDHVYLDVTHKDPEETKKHFPNIYEKCLSLGIDITKDYIPVAPAAHYLCGGILVDLNGQSSIERLYAVGECSCTGLHGGNRLASNSLIEAVVYADAAAKHSLKVVDQYAYNEAIPEWNDEGTRSPEEMVLITQSMKEVNQIMSTYVGIVRSDLRLKRAWDRLDIIYEETESLFKRSVASREICELRNMVNVGYLIMRQAMERKESRGLHYTIDYPHAKK